MRMLFTCRPTTGHFQPLAGLAREAVRRGHSVTFATAEPALSLARAAGFATEPAGLSDAENEIARRDAGIAIRDLPPQQARQIIFRRVFAALETPPRLADLNRICAKTPPDILVHEVAELAGPLAAAIAGVPWVTVGFGPLLQPDVADIAAEAVGPLWRAAGHAPPRWAGLYQHLYVDPFPPALQISAITELPEAIRLRPERGGSGAPSRPETGLVYVTFGTLWNTGPEGVAGFRTAILGAAAAAARVIVTTGRDTDPAVLGTLPPHVEAHPFVPQDEILPACACVVAHGGSGTLLGALAVGVPLVLLPQFGDQFYNAARAVDAGVALSLLPRAATQEAVTHAVRAVLQTPDFAARAATVQAELAVMPDAGAVLTRIEALGHQA